MIEIEDDIDLDTLFKDVKIDDKNMYIADQDKALNLLASFFARGKGIKSNIAIGKIRKEINQMFSVFSDISIRNELEYYQKFIRLSDRLIERNKLRRIGDKTVISFGGKFSAGKSRFINSISGINDVLPVAQRPTTSIPTYIISGQTSRITANSIYGYSVNLDVEEMKALTHEFYEAYRIGFSAFIESIMVETPSFQLNKNIALLDTPGYTKYDSDNNGKLSVSDKQKAYEQLKITDYLIWLVDIENGTLTQDDIAFIDSLKINTPILIVFNKAEMKDEENIRKIISEAENTIKRSMSTKCYGVTAYSSIENKEYVNRLVAKFLQEAATSEIRGNDIQFKFAELEQELKEIIVNERSISKQLASYIFNIISQANGVLEIQSLAALWSNQNRHSSKLNRLEKRYDKCCGELDNMIKEFLKIGGRQW